MAHATEVLAVSAAAVHRSTDVGATWSTLARAPLLLPLHSVVANEQNLLVGGQSGLALSSDRGSSWQPVLTGDAVLCLGVIHEAHRQQATVLAGTQSDGILRSEDGGTTWASANPGLFDLSVLCLADNLVGTSSGLYRSPNGGRSWREVSLPSGQVSVECLAASAGVALAGTDSAGAFISVDGGRVWTPLEGLPEAPVTAVALGSDPARIAVATTTGVFVSRDGGQNWRFDAPGLALSLAFVGDCLLAGVAHLGVLRLHHETAAWQSASAGLSGRVIVDLGRSSASGAFFTADVETGVERSMDAGRTWHTVLEPEAGGASGLAIFADGVYAATGSGLFASHDEGRSWSVVRTGAGALAVAAAPTGDALAAFDDGQLLVGYGGQWRTQTWPSDRGRILSLAVTTDGTLFAGTRSGEAAILWRSTDHAETWAAWFRGHAADAMRIAVSCSVAEDDQVLLGIGRHVWRPLRRTRERSGSEVHPVWQATALSDPVTALAFGAAPGTAYAGTSRGVYVSGDGAEHFVSYSGGLPDAPILALETTSGTDIYALGFGGTLWRARLELAASQSTRA